MCFVPHVSSYTLSKLYDFKVSPKEAPKSVCCAAKEPELPVEVRVPEAELLLLLLEWSTTVILVPAWSTTHPTPSSLSFSFKGRTRTQTLMFSAIFDGGGGFALALALALNGGDKTGALAKGLVARARAPSCPRSAASVGRLRVVQVDDRRLVGFRFSLSLFPPSLLAVAAAKEKKNKNETVT